MTPKSHLPNVVCTPGNESTPVDTKGRIRTLNQNWICYYHREKKKLYQPSSVFGSGWKCFSKTTAALQRSRKKQKKTNNKKTILALKKLKKQY